MNMPLTRRRFCKQVSTGLALAAIPVTATGIATLPAAAAAATFDAKGFLKAVRALGFKLLPCSTEPTFWIGGAPRGVGDAYSETILKFGAHRGANPDWVELVRAELDFEMEAAKQFSELVRAFETHYYKPYLEVLDGKPWAFCMIQPAAMKPRKRSKPFPEMLDCYRRWNDFADNANGMRDVADNWLMATGRARYSKSEGATHV